MPNDQDTRIRSGYRVIGKNTSNKQLSCWYFSDLDLANGFAKQLCEDTGEEIDVVRYIGSWRKTQPPVEFVPSIDYAEIDTKHFHGITEKR